MNRWRAEAANPPLSPPSAKENEGKWGRMGRRRMEAADPPLGGGGIPDHGAIPPYLLLHKIRVASRSEGPDPYLVIF